MCASGRQTDNLTGNFTHLADWVVHVINSGKNYDQLCVSVGGGHRGPHTCCFTGVLKRLTNQMLSCSVRAPGSA